MTIKKTQILGSWLSHQRSHCLRFHSNYGTTTAHSGRTPPQNTWLMHPTINLVDVADRPTNKHGDSLSMAIVDYPHFFVVHCCLWFAVCCCPAALLLLVVAVIVGCCPHHCCQMLPHDLLFPIPSINLARCSWWSFNRSWWFSPLIHSLALSWFWLVLA